MVWSSTEGVDTLEVALKRLEVAVHNYDVCHSKEMSDRLFEIAAAARKVVNEAAYRREESRQEEIQP